MGGITTGVGLFSGIDTATLIDQLIVAQSGQRTLAQRRLIQLQSQSAAYLDINSRLSAFKTAAAAFRTGNVFDTKLATSSNDGVLTASAGITATNGNYNFIVNRLVTTQQLLSRGFSDQDSSAVGLSQLTFEGAEARLDRDTALADLNNGSGINRGYIILNGEEIDLSTVGTVGEVLDAINSSNAGVTATVQGGSFVLDGVTTIADKTGWDVLSTLGLDGAVSPTMTGSGVYGLGTNTALTALNDGRGVGTRDATGEGVVDFNIVIDPGGANTTIGIRIGEIQELIDDELTTTSGAASTVGQVVDRINTMLADAGETNITASIDETNGRIVLTDVLGRDIDVENITVGSSTTTTATDLGLVGSYTGGTVNGQRVLAGLNTTLLSSINGGTGLNGATDLVDITTADGTNFTVDLSTATTMEEVVGLLNASGNITASLNSTGNGIKIVDNTTGVNDLVITGDTAQALGIDGTFADNETSGSNLQLAYIGASTALSSLNNGQGIGTGEFEIIDSNSVSSTITIDSNDKTLADVIDKINSAAAEVTARINDTGDGIIIEDSAASPGAATIQINDTEGSVASKLRISDEATGTGSDNYIDGSYETLVEFDPTATLSDIVTAINSAESGVRATIINDGAGANPYRLSLVSENSGVDGRFIIDSGGFDLGLQTLDEGDNSRIFYGSSDPARGVLISNSSNTLEGVIDGVTIDLLQVSEDPVTLSVTTDTAAIETRIGTFVEAFNAVIDRIDFQGRYNDETQERGPLLGDGTTIALRDRLFDALRGSNDGFTNTFDRLAQVGLVVGDEGKLTFDTDAFRTAYAQDPEAVEELFTRRDLSPTDNGQDVDGDGIIISDPDAATEFDALGVIVQLEELANSYVTNIGGILQNRTEALDNQISLQQSRIESIQRTLDSKRDLLQRQFLAMEQAIASFQTQGSALSQISLIG